MCSFGFKYHTLSIRETCRAFLFLKMLDSLRDVAGNLTVLGDLGFVTVAEEVVTLAGGAELDAEVSAVTNT